MAFQQSFRQSAQPTPRPQQTSSYRAPSQADVGQSQEWVLFAPSHASTTARTGTTHTAGLSRISDLGSLQTRERPASSLLLEDETDDGDLDSLDEGLHAFRDPPVYQSAADQPATPLLPTHDGLGTFPASQVLERLWQHEHHNPKRKHDGHHRGLSNTQRRSHAVEDIEAQASDDKRVRIEKWRMEQSQALIDEVERQTRQRATRHFPSETLPTIGHTAEQDLKEQENEPFWRRITRKFIRDIIGIDEPLLSVILGESLPGEDTPRASSPAPAAVSNDATHLETSWRDRLLRRIAKELGVFVHQLSPHPGAFTSYHISSSAPDYAGMPVRTRPVRRQSTHSAPDSVLPASGLKFPPTLQDPAHVESWGIEEEGSSSMDTLNLQKEREYWERELDVKMVFRYLRDRFEAKDTDVPPTKFDDSAARTAIIKHHHPLVARATRIPRQQRTSIKRQSSSCASESVKSARVSASSRHYWDLGGSTGSGSLLASGGHMGAWGEV